MDKELCSICGEPRPGEPRPTLCVCRDKTRGQVAYEAFLSAFGLKDGSWEKTPLAWRDKWEAVARTVLDDAA